MVSASHEALKWTMRAGYAARGVIYVLVGSLAFWAAFSPSQPEGTKDALSQLRAAPLGIAMLSFIAIGLFAYMIWRIVAGIADVEEHGRGAKGIFARAGQIVTGVIHGAIGLWVMALAIGSARDGQNSQIAWIQALLDLPGGRPIVATGALVLAGAGVYYVKKGAFSEYQDHLASATLLSRIDPLLKYGLIIYGGLLVLVAVSFGFAAWNGEAAQSGGLGQALQSLRDLAFGRVLLGFAGLGLIAFALYNLAEAVWRIVPTIDGPDVETMRRAAQRLT
ncbi:DUF1206 domain-containing protein [Sulfitobacter geojensis]|uniref:DUF1206 domain-containing protein n=1 Tax=Sulfitobacter geojensis TaxID=1342299 RepID=UPI0036DB3245